MLASPTTKDLSSDRTLTIAAYVSFIPVGIATVLLGPLLPSLSARWSLNYSQAGALFTAQYFASTCAVALSGVLASRWGYRFAIKFGLLLMAAGLALLLSGPKWLGIFCIAAYGAGLGTAVPAANLAVADANPERRSATLNLLNFFWSMGAVACPFLVAAAAKSNRLPLFLVCVSGFSLAVAIGIALLPAGTVQPSSKQEAGLNILSMIRAQLPAFMALAALFFLYVGTENAFGGWVATYAKTLPSLTPAMSLRTPSFFYAALMLGRWIAPLLLRRLDEVRLVQVGLIVACAGTAGLVMSHNLLSVVASACAAGLGLSAVYPITIALLSHQFGAAASQIGSFMFVLSNIGGGLLPWIVGLLSNHSGTLTSGLFVPLSGCALMFLLFLRGFRKATTVVPTS